MIPSNRGPSPKTVWAYAYQIVPPQTEDRLSAIQVLLDREHSDATHEGRAWSGTFISEQQVTHLLVVSDSPHQDHGVNGKLEAELDKLGLAFLLTMPMATANPDGAPRADRKRNRSGESHG